MVIQNLCYETFTKELKSIYLGHQNLIRYFIYYFEYQVHDNDPIGNDYVKITNYDFNEFRVTDYYNFRSLREAGIINPSKNSTTSSFNKNYPVDNLTRPIKSNSNPSRFDIGTPLCDDTNKIFLVTTNNKFLNPAHTITINKDQGIEERPELPTGSSSDKPNPMIYHRKKSLSSDKVSNKASNPDHTNKISLVTPDDTFSCYSQVITAIRNLGRKLELDISRVSTDYDYNIIGPHRNALFPDDGSNEVSKPVFDTASKPDLVITQCAKYLLNDPLNLNINNPGSCIACKYYVKHTALSKDTLPKCRKGSRPGVISRYEGNIPEEYHLTYFKKEHYSEKHQGQLSNIIALKCNTIIYIKLSMYNQDPSSDVNIPTQKGYISPLQFYLD